MAMNKQHKEVQVWLERLLGDKAVPSYELNEHTVGVLHEMMKRNVAKEKDTQLLIEDYRQKAEEYSVESQRLENILQQIHLSTASLSQSGLMSVRTLANLALTLHTKDASDTSLLLALQNLDSESRKVEEERRANKKVLDNLTNKHKTAVLKHSALEKALEDLEKKTAEEQPQQEKYTRETQFLQNKAKEYRKQAKKIGTHLQTTGVDPSLFHQRLVDRAKSLQELKQEIIPMKKKLESYHGLPPDAIQAHMKLDELKDKVAKLEDELTKKIDVMCLTQPQ